MRVSDDQWLWFVPENENHGMTGTELASALEKPILWAIDQGLEQTATNGIIDTDHGLDSLHNRESVDRRVRLLAELASDHERSGTLTIELISLNDSFVRMSPKDSS